MQTRLARIVLALIAVGTAAGCNGQKIETLKDAVCCDGGYEYRYGDRFAGEKASSDRFAALERDNKSLSAKSRSLEDQLAGRDRELTSARADLNQANARSADLERQLAVAQGSLASSQSQVSALQAGAGDSGKLAAELAAAQASLAALQAGTGDKDALAAELEKAKRRISELETQLAALGATGADKEKLAADLAAAQQRTAELEKQLAERDRQLAGLRGDLSAEMAKLKDAQRGLVRALRPQIEKGNIMVDLNNERLLINLASGYLFGSGEDELKSAGADALKQVGSILKDFPEYHVSVDGHTDDRPIRSGLKKKYPSNKELSEARAANAALALGQGGLNAVTTHGYADTRPVVPNSTDTGRAKNRRVEVRVTK